jgi:hypothetical protein
MQDEVRSICDEYRKRIEQLNDPNGELHIAVESLGLSADMVKAELKQVAEAALEYTVYGRVCPRLTSK